MAGDYLNGRRFRRPTRRLRQSRESRVPGRQPPRPARSRLSLVGLRGYNDSQKEPTMITLRVTADVKDDRRVVLTLPLDVPTGRAELVVTVESPKGKPPQPRGVPAAEI